MKVLFVAHSGDISGGANRILLDLITVLKEKHGVTCGVLMPAGQCALREACEQLGIAVHMGKYHSCCTVYHGEIKDLLRFFKLLAAPVLDWFSVRSFEKNIPRDYDLVYTNDRIVIAGGYLARRRGIGHIWHARCFGRINQNHFSPMWYRMMERYSDQIVTISNALLRDFEPHIRQREKLHLIHDGIVIGRHLTHKEGGHTGMRMLLAGRVIPSKGQMDAVRALDILVNSYGADAELYLAGELPRYAGGNYAEELKALIDQAGLRQRVHFMGEVSDMPALRAQMDVELMCAWCEAFGLVSVEGMCAGLPIVGSDAGGTPDIIRDGETGLLYRQRDAKDLAEKLLWLYRHPQEAERFGEEGRERAQEVFSIERCAQDVLRAIHEVSNGGYEE